MPPTRSSLRIASENANKELVLRDLLRKHADEPVLVIGQYLSQLRKISSSLKAPMITGATANARRDLIGVIQRGDPRPRGIQGRELRHRPPGRIGGHPGFRDLRLPPGGGPALPGRILRPKERISTFYTLVTKETSEEIFAHKRQVFLAEQGYKYRIEEWWSLDDLDV